MRNANDGRPRVALIHNILAPYRIGLFNAVASKTEINFTILLGRMNHPTRRRWKTSLEDVEADARLLRTVSYNHRSGALDFSTNVPSALTQLQPDVVVVTGWDLPANWIALAWAKRRSVPTIAWIESWKGSVRRGNRFFEEIRRIYLGQCDGAIVPGELSKDLVQSLVPGLPTWQMPNSVGVSRLRALPQPKSAHDAYFVGELNRGKGVDLVLAGIEQLLDIFARVHIVGSGPMEQNIRVASRRYERFIYHGHLARAELSQVAEKCSTFILPSRSDCWPLAAVEAIVARRRLVLGSGVGSAFDLMSVAGSAVQRMSSPTVSQLTRSARALGDSQVPEHVRTMFTHEQSAESFVEATLSVLDPS